MWKRKIVSFAFYIPIFLLLNLPLYQVGERRCNIYQVYRITEEGIRQVGEEYSEFYRQFLMLQKIDMGIVILFQLVCILYLVTLLLNRKCRVNAVALILAVAYAMLGMTGMESVTNSFFALCVPLLMTALCLFEFLFVRMAEVWQEATAQAKVTARQERKRKREKKIRLYFPGVYTRLFYQIVWKNFRHDWKDYRMLLLSSGVISALSFSGIACYRLMEGTHRGENFLIGQGLGRILWNAMLPMGACAAFLLIFVMVYYLKKWMANYSIFVTLGTRERALYLILALEILFAFVVSFGVGCLAGNGLVFCLRRAIEKALGDGIVLETMNGLVYLKTLGFMAAIYLVSLMASRDITWTFHPVRAASMQIVREKMPGIGKWIGTAAGILVMTVCFTLYFQVTRHECMYLLAGFFLGTYLLLRFGGAWYLSRVEKGSRYLQTLMRRNHLYHRARTCARYLTAWIMLAVCGGFYYGVPIVSSVIAEEPESMFPYDYVCLANGSDEEIFRGLEENYGVSLIRYPMVRVSNVDRTEQLEGRGEQRTQGQQIGISETTYHQLKQALDKDYRPRDLGLDEGGTCIYVVHQQDRSVKAQPIDWTYGSSRPFLHIGVPVKEFFIDWNIKNTIFSQRKIVGQEFSSVIGCFRQGNLENLVVFSDAYFEEAQQMWKDTDIQYGEFIEDPDLRIEGVTILEGPTQLVLMQADEKYEEEIRTELSRLEENHAYEMKYDFEVSCWYSGKEGAADMKTEHLMKILANGIVSVVMLMTAMFLFYIKALSEMEEKQERARFLSCMGMRRKERIRILRGEIWFFYLVQVIVSVLVSAGFTAATWHARMYSVGVILQYLPLGLAIMIGWLAVEGIFVWILGLWVTRKVEGKHE